MLVWRKLTLGASLRSRRIIILGKPSDSSACAWWVSLDRYEECNGAPSFLRLGRSDILDTRYTSEIGHRREDYSYHINLSENYSKLGMCIIFSGMQLFSWFAVIRDPQDESWWNSFDISILATQWLPKRHSFELLVPSPYWSYYDRSLRYRYPWLLVLLKIHRFLFFQFNLWWKGRHGSYRVPHSKSRHTTFHRLIILFSLENCAYNASRPRRFWMRVPR